MKKILLVGLFAISLASCKKSDSTNSVDGLYIENSPVNGRSQLNFLTGNLVVKSEPGNSFADTFRYSFTPTKIILTPSWTTQYPSQEFDFQEIDDNSIKIQNLYPSIPEGPQRYMIFKK
jgi:hypothetical protein